MAHMGSSSSRKSQLEDAALLSWVRQIGEWIVGAAAFLGPVGVFVVAFSDSAFIPLPQGVDALLLAHALARPETAYLAAGLAVLGSVLGSTVLYFLGKRGGHAMLRRRLTPQGIDRLSGLVGRWGAALLIPVTMIPLPLPMKPMVLAAGIFQMPLPSFCVAIGLSRVPRYFGVAYLSVEYGGRALELAGEHLPLAVMLSLLLIAAFAAAHTLSNRWLNRPA